MVKILNITYAQADLEHLVANSSQLNAEERTLLLSLPEDFKELFDGNLGDWVTEPFDLELKPDSKPFNSRYYPVPRINKKFFRKELKRLVEVEVLTPAQQNQYAEPIW